MQATPRLFVDGIIDCGNAPELWQPYVEDRIPVASPFEMSFFGHFDFDSLSGQFTVAVFAEDNPGAENLWLRIALTESGIYYQAPNGATIHNYIFREMIPSTEGRDIEIVQGETKYYSFSFRVPEPLEPGNCALVAFIQSDQDREIIQGARIKVSDLNGTTGAEQDPELPAGFSLNQNYPNPFNSGTRIDFSTMGGQVRVGIFDITGSLVRTLFQGRLESGDYSVVWDGNTDDGSRASSGIYYYRLDIDEHNAVRKMTYLK